MEFATCVRQAQWGGTSNRSIAGSHGGCNQCMIQVCRYFLKGRLRHFIVFTQPRILERSGHMTCSTPFIWAWLAASSGLALFFCQSWRAKVRWTIAFRVCLLATSPGARVERSVVLSPNSPKSTFNGQLRHHIRAVAGTRVASAQFSWNGCRIGTTVKVHLGTLATAGEAAVSANRFFRILYKGEAWLPPEKATEAGELCFDFLKKYASLASTALASGRQLWILQPKHHALHHICLDLLQGGSRGFTLNPLCVSTQQDEDYIGRPSRLARRVTAQEPVAHRVISRLMQATYSQYVKAGYIRPSKKQEYSSER